MGKLKAVVRNGRVAVDEPVDYPEGTVLDLEISEPEDELDAEELARLDAALERLRADIAAGRTISAEDLIRELRSGR